MAVYDLRSALEKLRAIPGQLAETDVEVDPEAELAGVYRYVGAGGTVMRPTKEGPAVIFNKVKGHEDARVVIGLLASRKRVGYLLDCDPKRLGYLLKDSVEHPLKPIVISSDSAKCQELPVIRVKAVTTRKNPIMQTCIGPSEEHVSMAGIPTEASILAMLEKAMPRKCLNVYNASFGGGKYVTMDLSEEDDWGRKLLPKRHLF